MTVTSSDGTAAAAYKRATEPTMEETLLLAESDAQDEADRRLAIWSTQRHVYQFDGLPHQMLVNLGDYRTLRCARFGLSSGKAGQVIGVRRDWLHLATQIEVLA